MATIIPQNEGSNKTNDAAAPYGKADTSQLLRHPMVMVAGSESEHIALHDRTLLALARDGEHISRALPSDDPRSRRMLARARIEKAALTLNDKGLELLSKISARLLREQCQELYDVNEVPVLGGCPAKLDMSASGVPPEEWPTHGDVVHWSRESAEKGQRESAAKEVIESLRDTILDYADDEDEVERNIKHTLRVDAIERGEPIDGVSKPLRYSPDFRAEQFADAAPRLAALLDRAHAAPGPSAGGSAKPGQCKRADGRPLIPAGQSADERHDALVKVFSKWQDDQRAEEVTRDDLERLAKAMLRAMGARNDDAKHAFEAEYTRETRRDQRAAAG